MDNESRIKFFQRKWVCRLREHQYCKCGWCKRHPICVRCNFDKVCNTIHDNLMNGIKCQHATYDLLKSLVN